MTTLRLFTRRGLFTLLLLPVAAAAQEPVVAPAPPPGGQVIQVNPLQSTSDRAANTKQTLDKAGQETTESIKGRFELAGDALFAISSIIANVNQVLGFTALEQSLGAGTNPWSDEHFRNGYDRLEGWLTPVSLALSSISIFLPNQKDRQNSGAAFLGLSGLSKLIGARLGQQTGSKFEETASTVEFSRRAYDDLRGRYATTNEYVQSNKALLGDLDAFRSGDYAKAAAPAGTDEEKRRVIVSAGSFLTRLDLVMTQIPALLQLYENTVKRYCPQAIEQATKDPNNMGALECRSQLADQSAPFVLVGDAKKFILQAAVQLAELRANLKAADRVRVLTPSLRGALAGK